MNFLSLFTGIGGIDLGLTWAGMNTTGQVEINEACRCWLKHHWPNVKRWSDIRDFSFQKWTDHYGDNTKIDLIAGGFPCQDISVAGKGKGIEGARSGLWKEMFRIICEFKPRWILVENVPALRTRGADRVLADLESEGYACETQVVGACHAGACHTRKRVYIVAHSDGQRLSKRREISIGTEKKVTKSSSQCRYEWPAPPGQRQREFEKPRLVEFGMGGTDDGISTRILELANMEALIGYGNAVIPQVIQAIGQSIIQIEKEMR